MPTTENAGMKETPFRKKISEQLKLGGALLFNVSGSAYQKRGWPDLQVYFPLWTGHLELKGQKTALPTMQRVILRRLRRVGVAAYVLRVHNDDLRLQDYESKTISEFVGWRIMKDTKGRIGRAILKWLGEHAIAEREMDDEQDPLAFH